MADESIPAIGIDLGTTFSVVSKLEENGSPVTIVNAEGDRITPSVVLFDGQDVVVGREALKRLRHRGGARGGVLEARRGLPRLPQGAGRQAVPSRGDRSLHSQQVAARCRGPDRAFQQGRDHGAGLFRRGPPQSYARCGLHRRFRGAGHHERAHGGGRGLWFSARLSEPRREDGETRDDHGLRPGRRDLRRHRDGDPRHGVQGSGHRRRRPPGRLGLGPAAGGSGGGRVHPPEPRRPAGRPPRGGQALEGM